MKAKSRIRINKGKLVVRVSILILALLMVNVSVSFVKYPEQYLITWRNQLEDDLAKGSQKMLDYYNKTYIANGKRLFGDKYITTGCLIEE
jgi:hypothetical protein